MILRTETVEQVVDGDVRVRLTKDIVMTPGRQPLGMVRKRPLPPRETRGAVLLVHGFAQNRYTWHTSRRSFSAYLASQGWDVFSVDLRGHGRSRRFGADRPRILDDYIREDMPSFAAEAERLSGHSKVFLIGHSMGGLISYSAGSTVLRDQLRGIVTLGSPYTFGLGSRSLLALAMALRVVRATGVFDANPRLPVRLVGRHLRKRRRIWDTKLLPIPVRVWDPGKVEDEVLEEYLDRAFDWSSIQIVYDILRRGAEPVLHSHDGRTDYGAAFEHLKRPLLVIAGSGDTLAPPDSVEPAFTRSASPDKTFRVFPLGHIDLIVGRQAPTTVWPLVGGWLARR